MLWINLNNYVSVRVVVWNGKKKSIQCELSKSKYANHMPEYNKTKPACRITYFLGYEISCFFVKKEWVIWTPDFVDFIVIHKRLHLESLFFDLWRGSADTQNQRKSHYQNYCYCSHIRIQRTWWGLSEPCIIKNLYPLCWYLNSKYTFGLTS